MRDKPNIKIYKWLFFFSWIYGIIVFFRNKFYDWDWLGSEEFDIPVICIGNIAVGGTGKTPHTEYLIRLLKGKKRVAVLSRGYGRKTSGFILSDENSTSATIGDEPYQIKNKFPDILVAVDERRRRGIHKLLNLDSPPEVILLDDAFQHRAVIPSYSIVLTDYNRPVYRDRLLPVGRLRESAYNASRANMIIMTKCPADLQPIDFRLLRHNMDVFPYQELYFSKIIYKRLIPVFGTEKGEYDIDYLVGKSVLVVTGIASPEMILKQLGMYADKVLKMTYPDHHEYSKSDIQDIVQKFAGIVGDEKLIVVTEKDASRLVFSKGIPENLMPLFYYLPIEVDFVIEEDKEQFNKKILEHVRDYTRDRAILKR